MKLQRGIRRFMVFLFLCKVASVTGQLDSVHILPPLHSRNEPGQQYLYLSTPSKIPIVVRLFNSSGKRLRDCNGTDISKVSISNSAPRVICLGLDYGAPLLVSLKELNRPLKQYGIVLKSGGMFYANLRIFSNNNFQAGSLTCKGRWAGGRRFRIGHVYSDNDPSGHKCHFVGITAVKDGTTVCLKDIPKNLRFAGNSPKLTFKLDKGESYVFSTYIDSRVPQNDNGLMGALLLSNHKIFVNCGSWSGSPNGSKRDMGIDQITPMSRLGNEYILIKGLGPPSLETPIIIADSDQTEIYINGRNKPYKTLQAGQWIVLNTGNYTSAQNMYIRTTKKVAVYQMMGVDDDPRTVGLNFLPALSCIGDTLVDNIVDIQRIGPRPYQSGLVIVAENGANLWINNKKSSRTPSPVPGNPNYVTYRILSGLPNNISIRSEGSIQVGMFGSSEPSGFAGYFSGFRSLDISIEELSDPCADSLVGIMSNVDYFEWYRNDSLLVDETRKVLKIRRQGRYKLVGYQCNGVKDSTEEVVIGVADTIFLDSMICGLERDSFEEMHYSNSFGCDSTVFKALHALPNDTVMVFETSCISVDTGVFIEVLSNIHGCDSFVITRVDWEPPDEVQIEQIVCNPRDSGVVIFKERNKMGCDSITRIIYRLGRKDTVDVLAYVCNPDSTGLKEYVYPNTEGCDSLVRYHFKEAKKYYYEIREEYCQGERVIIDKRKVTKDTILTITYKTQYGCDSVYKYELVFHPVYEIYIKDSICQGESIAFEGMKLTESGRYSRRFASKYGCDSVRILDLNVLSLPTPEFEPQAVYCYGDSVELKLKESYSSYVWFDGYTGCCKWRGSGGKLSVTVTDENTCTNSAEIEIADPVIIDARWSAEDILCYGDKYGRLEINRVSGGTKPYIYRLNRMDFDPPVSDRLPKGNYRMEVWDANGCYWSDSVQIHAPDSPLTVKINADTQYVRWGSSALLFLEISGGEADKITWRINDSTSITDEQEITLYPRQNTVIRVEIVDENGCIARDELLIKVYYDPRIYIPNVFTPNKDGINDSFELFPNDHIAKIHLLRIYSRWGELLYEVYDQQPGSTLLLWDGRFKGRKLNSSVVVYYVEAESIDHRILKLSGDVTIVY